MEFNDTSHLNLNNPAFLKLIKNVQPELNKEINESKGKFVKGQDDFESFENHTLAEGLDRFENLDVAEIAKRKRLKELNQLNQNKSMSENSDLMVVSKKELNEVFTEMLKSFLGNYKAKIEEATVRKTMKIVLSESRKK